MNFKISSLTLILFVILFSAVALSAQDKKDVKVSEKAKAAFSKIYPKVADVKWQKEGKNYEVEFKQNDVATSVDIDAEGNIAETESAIAKTDLPKGVEEYVAQNYKGWSITETAKIVDAKAVVTFEAQISKGKKKKDLIFTKDGNLVVKK